MNAQNALKNDVITFTWWYTISYHTPPFTSFACLLLIYRFMKHIPLLQFGFYRHLFSKKNESWNFGVKIKRWGIQDVSFVEHSNLHLMACFGCILLKKLYIVQAFQHLLFFPKGRNMMSLKCNVLKQKISTYWYKVPVKDVQSMPEKVLKVSQRHLPPLLS